MRYLDIDKFVSVSVFQNIKKYIRTMLFSFRISDPNYFCFYAVDLMEKLNNYLKINNLLNCAKYIKNTK